jgi:hypothetical protein
MSVVLYKNSGCFIYLVIYDLSSIAIADIEVVPVTVSGGDTEDK